MPSTMKEIYVALEHGGKAHPVGVIRFDSTQNFGYFTYLASYEGPPLDPINLNYRKPYVPGQDRLRKGERTFVVDAVNSPGLLHQVFVDGMPGRWGNMVLQAEYPEIRQMRDVEKLHWMGARTTGALSFFVHTRVGERTVQGLEELEVVRAKCAEFMVKLAKMGLDGIRNPAVASHGGVMPKAGYEDGSGRHWIAKFDQPGDGLQYSLMENAACQMAKRCGIDVPETKAMADGMGGHMFLTERFDRSASNRLHKASLMTLTGAKDAGAGDYRDIFRVLKEICRPADWPQQRDEMLRRMAFNVGLNVTDDHLRNHEVCLKADGSWALSPAFDLVPVSGASPHQCAVFGKARADINLEKPASAALWTSIAHELGVDPEQAMKIVNSVGDTIRAEWPALVRSCGLNKFNQMNALMATEVGCGTDFPSDHKAPANVALSATVASHLKVAGAVVSKAAAIFAGKQTDMQARSELAASLMRLNSEVARLSQQLRESGQPVAAEAFQALQLRTGAAALIEADPRDRHLANDYQEVEAHLRSVLVGHARDQAKGPAAASQRKLST
jgi:serine/threonine-protein kinase HipA